MVFLVLVLFSVFVGIVVSVGQRGDDRMTMFNLGFFSTLIFYGVLIAGVEYVKS